MTKQELQRGWNLKQNYGLTLAGYAELMAKQSGRCAICKTTDPGSGHKYLCVDHDHVTGVIRGLLCFKCNIGIGKLGDNAAGVAKALAYLAPESSSVDEHY